MLKAKNIQIIDYPIGDKIAELLELSVQAGNAKAAKRRRAIFINCMNLMRRTTRKPNGE